MKLPPAKTVIEPFKIKVVEPLVLNTYEQRCELISKCGFNLFKLSAESIVFDLLTDSGTSAMSAQQWAAIMQGDESYAGSRSYVRFENKVQSLTGMQYVIPTHQGRSAEALLMKALLKPGDIVLGNTHFDTTRANIEAQNAIAVDLPAFENETDFKGNIDLLKLKQSLERESSKIKAIILTITNNAVGGQPVSMQNIIETKKIAKKYNIPLFIDAARFAENSYFIKLRESTFANKTVRAIALEIFSQADGVLMSAKKDAFGNIGGFLALNDQSLAEEVRALMVITEGFPTYGGLAGRDMEALSVGLEEILDEHYLAYRIRSVEYFANGLHDAGYEIIQPCGGHAVYIDAANTLPHLSVQHFPGQSLCVALYESIGIRSVEVGTVMLGKTDHTTQAQIPAPFELVRLAMPRRVYTQSHVDYMIETMSYLHPHLHSLPAYQFDYEPEVLRHFTATFNRIC